MAGAAHAQTFHGGGPHGARVYWPAGLAELTPAGRARALELGRWPDGRHVIFADGRRLYRPGEARRLAEELEHRG